MTCPILSETFIGPDPLRLRGLFLEFGMEIAIEKNAVVDEGHIFEITGVEESF